MAYYPGSAWFNMLWAGGYEFLTPPPEITPEGVKQSPSDGARKLNARIVFFYPATGITPAMCMRLTGMGSQYLMASRGADGEYLDGARDYRLHLPADVPESRFWSVMVYDRQTRSMLAERAGSSPAWAASRAPSSRTPTARPTSTSAPRRRQERSTTGSRPSPARAGSRSSASTAHSSRSSTRAGDRARSSP